MLTITWVNHVQANSHFLKTELCNLITVIICLILIIKAHLVSGISSQCVEIMLLNLVLMSFNIQSKNKSDKNTAKI